MKNDRNKHLRSLTAALLSIVVAIGIMVVPMTDTHAESASWNVEFTKTAGNSSLGYTAFRSMQGIGFDTYSGEDGYEFVQGDANTQYADKFSLVHFTMDSDGWCTRTKKLSYTQTQVGHANDATVYQDASGNKWLFVALYGTYEETISGVSADLRVIDLSEYDGGTPKVYNCNVNEINNVSGVKNITGITYMGKTYNENGKRVPAFVLLSGRTMVEAYLTQSGTAMTFHPTGKKGRIEKPSLPSGDEAVTQGIAYHNHNIYMTAEGKKGSSETRVIVARISTEYLFDGDSSTDKKMELYSRDGTKGQTIDKNETASFSKYGPEAVFFTNLNKKSNMYIGVNRVKGGVDDDAIMRSAIRY